jgi:diacylglycerol kinase
MVHKHFLAFGYALKGLRTAWSEELHFRFHIFFAVVALLMSWAFHISRAEFITVLILIALVLSAELLNTALEELCDKFSPTHDPTSLK